MNGILEIMELQDWMMDEFKEKQIYTRKFRAIEQAIINMFNKRKRYIK